jgi:hypothetical protein
MKVFLWQNCLGSELDFETEVILHFHQSGLHVIEYKESSSKSICRCKILLNCSVMRIATVNNNRNLVRITYISCS